jgi:hypothetical protein
MGKDYSTTPAEEMTSGEMEGDTRAGRQKEAADVPETQTIMGVVSNTNTSQYRGRTYYFAEIDARKLMTDEPDTGANLIDAQGQEIAAECVRRPGKGPNDYRVVSFRSQPPTDSPAEVSADDPQ